MKKRYISEIIIGFMIIISMTISISFILRVEKKIDKFEYIIDNSNLESNIAIMVQDSETREYLRSDLIPIGSYTLNVEKTNCVGRAIISDYNAQKGTIKFETEAADECYLFFDAYYGAVKTILDLYQGQGTEYGNGKLYLHDSALANSAEDGSYRFSGADPDNYLCFEGDTCDDNHKYRIIGIFGDNIKVIKMTSIGSKVWNSSGSNTWDGSTMDTYLNNEWLTSFGHQDLIEDYDWHVGGHNAYNVTVKVMYDAELNSTPTVNRKVGLMYASDYDYAALNNYWTASQDRYNEGAMNTDWLYLKSTEWTISRYSSNSYSVFYMGGEGNMGLNGVNNARASRPVFYLKLSVGIKGGSGTKTDPWIMGL